MQGRISDSEPRISKPFKHRVPQVQSEHDKRDIQQNSLPHEAVGVELLQQSEAMPMLEDILTEPHRALLRDRQEVQLAEVLDFV